MSWPQSRNSVLPLLHQDECVYAGFLNAGYLLKIGNLIFSTSADKFSCPCFCANKTGRSGKQQIMTLARIHPEEIWLKLDLISLNQEYSELDSFFPEEWHISLLSHLCWESCSWWLGPHGSHNLLTATYFYNIFNFSLSFKLNNVWVLLDGDGWKDYNKLVSLMSKHVIAIVKEMLWRRGCSVWWWVHITAEAISTCDYCRLRI